MTLWRVYGGGSAPLGRYFFCCLRQSVSDDAQHWVDASALATPRENLRQHLAGVTVPAGTTVLVRTVADNFADQFGHLEKGGNTQIFMPYVRGFPFDEYRKIAESSHLLVQPGLREADLAADFVDGDRESGTGFLRRSILRRTVQGCAYSGGEAGHNRVSQRTVSCRCT